MPQFDDSSSSVSAVMEPIALGMLPERFMKLNRSNLSKTTTQAQHSTAQRCSVNVFTKSCQSDVVLVLQICQRAEGTGHCGVEKVVVLHRIREQ